MTRAIEDASFDQGFSVILCNSDNNVDKERFCIISATIVVVGSSNTDLVVRVPRLPGTGETVLGDDLSSVPGGKGANQAVAAARLGAQVTFVACVGQDAYGTAAVQHYRDEGIDVRYVRTTPTAPSGVALIFVDAAGQNMIAVGSGANLHLTPADVEQAASAIRAADAVLLQLEIPLATVEAAIDVAHRAGVRVILNPAPAQALPARLLSQVDVITPNEHEARVTAGLPPDTPLPDVAAALQAAGVATVLVTLGEQGAFVCDRAGAAFHVPAVAVTAVDTVAAGDAFNGGLAVALSQGMDLASAVRYANAVAAISVTRAGAQNSLPTAGEVGSWE